MNTSLLSNLSDEELINALMLKCSRETEEVLKRLQERVGQGNDLEFEASFYQDEYHSALQEIKAKDMKINELQNIIAKLQKDMPQ